MRRRIMFVIALFLWLDPAASIAVDNPLDPAPFVRALLNAADSGTSLTEIQLAIDKFVDPAVDLDAARRELAGMLATVKRMLATIPPDASSKSMEKMKALRSFIYESGWWNDHRPLQYDLDDPYGQNLHSKLLTHYLASRKGNCVSMPTLFLVLGERLGLNLTLSTAPLHVFIKWTDDSSGQTFNLETTSGAGFTRDAYYREKLPMTDKAIASGVYLKTLSRREAVALMATTVMDHLLETRRYDDAIAVADALLEAYPAHAYALAKKGTAYHRLLTENFIQKYKRESDIPADLLPYATALYRANQEAFDQAEALGWRMPELK